MTDESEPTGTALEHVTAALLARPLDLNRLDVSREAHVSLQAARKFWQSLGFPLVTSDEPLFTQADVEALKIVAGLVRRGDLDEATALQLTRAFARSADRLASWQVQLVAEAHEASGPRLDGEAVGLRSGPATARAIAESLVDLADELEPLLIYAWRRHLADSVSRLLADAEPGAEEAGSRRYIGFADLVSFSALVRRSSQRELADVVRHFEVLGSDIVAAHGGRIVKTVGDSILFANQGAGPAAATALDLVDAIAGDDVLPDVRAGVASGPVLLRLGDVFGTTVNRAARLTAVAHPGSVVVDSPTAVALREVSGFDLEPMPRRTLNGVGKVQPYLLSRAGNPVRPRLDGAGEDGAS